MIRLKEYDNFGRLRMQPLVRFHKAVMRKDRMI